MLIATVVAPDFKIVVILEEKMKIFVNFWIGAQDLIQMYILQIIK